MHPIFAHSISNNTKTGPPMRYGRYSTTKTQNNLTQYKNYCKTCVHSGVSGHAMTTVHKPETDYKKNELTSERN